MRVYAAQVDPVGCAAASDELVRIWSDLRTRSPQSAFVRQKLEQAQALKRQPCLGIVPLQ
jgi:hypothetical protein